MVTVRGKAVDLKLPNYEVTIYKPDSAGDTVDIAVNTPRVRKHQLTMYIQDLPVEEVLELLTKTVEMLKSFPVKKQRRLRGI